MLKAVLTLALTITAAPALAATGGERGASSSDSGGKICTRIQRRGGSRLAYQRVCLTQAEWRNRLGPDWRMQLSGRNPEEDFESADFRSREQATTTYQGGNAESPQ